MATPIGLRGRIVPRLLVFAACERVIYDVDVRLASLITLLEAVVIPVSAGTTVLPDLIIQSNWWAFSMWKREETDEGTYSQKIQVIRPDGVLWNELTSDVFELTEAGYKYRQLITGFPVGVPGNLILRAFVRSASSTEWSIAGEYPIRVDHVVSTPPASQ